MNNKSDKPIRIDAVTYAEQKFIRQATNERSIKSLNAKVWHNLFQLISMYHDKDVDLEFEFCVLEHYLKITAKGSSSFVLCTSEKELQTAKLALQKQAQADVKKAKKALEIKEKMCLWEQSHTPEKNQKNDCEK